jgi:hypothetical protein
MVAQFDPKSGKVLLTKSKRNFEEDLPKVANLTDDSVYLTPIDRAGNESSNDIVKVHPSINEAGPGVLQMFKNYTVSEFQDQFSVCEPNKTNSHVEYRV